MKITKNDLKKIISEELKKINENIQFSEIRNFSDEQLKKLFVDFFNAAPKDKELTVNDVSTILQSVQPAPQTQVSIDPSKLGNVPVDKYGRPIPDPEGRDWRQALKSDQPDPEISKTSASPLRGEKTVGARGK